MEEGSNEEEEKGEGAKGAKGQSTDNRQQCNTPVGLYFGICPEAGRALGKDYIASE